METQDYWNAERYKLDQEQFKSGNIVKARRPDLERYLVILANSPIGPGLKGTNSPEQIQHAFETEAFSAIIRHLLIVRLGEELHAKSHKISVLALWAAAGSVIVSLVAAVFAGVLVHVEGQKYHSTERSPAVFEPASQLQQVTPLSTELKALSPTTQTDSYIAMTNSTPVPSIVSTNR